MGWPEVVLVLGVLAAVVACCHLWLRARAGAMAESVAEVQRRLDRVENEVRVKAVAAPAPALRMGVYGGKP